MPVEQTTDAESLHLDLLKRQAIIDCRKKHGIDEEIADIDSFGAYWRRKA